jgi:hypothetical protein
MPTTWECTVRLSHGPGLALFGPASTAVRCRVELREAVTITDGELHAVRVSSFGLVIAVPGRPAALIPWPMISIVTETES